MKWMLFVFVVGAYPELTDHPVQTNLIFDSLDACLTAEERNEYSSAYNAWRNWAQANKVEADYPNSEKFMRRRFGVDTRATCIPHAG